MLQYSMYLDHEEDLGEYDLSDVRIIGFDQHNELEYLNYGEYLMSLKGESWGKVKAVVNSHSQRVLMYRRMLDVFNKEMENFSFDTDAAKRVLDAGHFKKRS